jgi:hypothetical protein
MATGDQTTTVKSRNKHKRKAIKEKKKGKFFEFSAVVVDCHPHDLEKKNLSPPMGGFLGCADDRIFFFLFFKKRKLFSLTVFFLFEHTP